MRILGWCHNGYAMAPAREVVRRAHIARLDALIIKYGDPAFEREVSDAGVAWGVERFVYAGEARAEGRRLADAVGAGAAFAVANCEPEGGWHGPGAAVAARTLIDTFRARWPDTPLTICADLRPGRSLDAPFAREAAASSARGGIDGFMAMVYPRAFGQSVAAAFDAAYPGGRYLRLPCEPVLQTYDGIGAGAVVAQLAEARRRGASGCSIYTVEAASEEELEAVGRAKKAPAAAPDDLVRAAVAYRAGALAILDHGTPGELEAWGRLWSGGGAAPSAPASGVAALSLPAERLRYLRAALRILDVGTPGELRALGALFSGGAPATGA